MILMIQLKLFSKETNFYDKSKFNYFEKIKIENIFNIF